mmetsp:Transcript_25202/g.79456  ORF Transcript_25202/g.79456 Transcript_25202/m.79456 type:complete len:205 (-) Transcript_25202:1416-2030(-)
MRPSFLRLASMSWRWNLRSRAMSCFSCSDFISSCRRSSSAPRSSDISANTASRRPWSSAAPAPSCAARLGSAEACSRSWRSFICSRSARSESTSCALSRPKRSCASSAPRRASSSWRSSSARSRSHCFLATSRESPRRERSSSSTSRALADRASASESFRCMLLWRSSAALRSSSQTFCTLSVIRWKSHVERTSTWAGPEVFSA